MSKKGNRRNELLVGFLTEVSRQSTWTVMFHHAASLRLGLNATDAKCVGLLQETGALTAGELAAMTGLTTGTVTGVIDRLEAFGFVRRIADQNDRRRIIVEVVDNPVRAKELADVYGPLGEATSAMLQKYTDAELKFAIDFVKSSADLLKQQTQNLLKTKAKD